MWYNMKCLEACGGQELSIRPVEIYIMFNVVK